MNNYNYIIDAFTQDGNNVNEEIDNLTVGCITSKNNNFELDSQGNLTVKTLTETNPSSGGNTVNLLDVYPVGAIYMSVNSTSPDTLFGGTWQRIQDVFLLAAGNTYAAASTGGAATVTLNTNQIPSHSHSFSGTTSTNGNHSHTGNTLEVRSQISNQASNDCVRFTTSSAHHYGGQVTNDAGNHAHTFSGTTGAQGSGAAHENMPPYLAVYIWKRTA